jgi:hypothetical protein
MRLALEIMGAGTESSLDFVIFTALISREIRANYALHLEKM